MKPLVVVMGVAGCGKTEVGIRLSKALGVPFYDGDDYHPPENVAKMSAGNPLNDDDRVGWLARLADLLGEHRERGCIVACSALKEKYRDQLRGSSDPRFVHLVVTPATAEARLRSRAGHFMPASLVASQFDALEAPATAATVDAEQPLDDVVRRAIDALEH